MTLVKRNHRNPYSPSIFGDLFSSEMVSPLSSGFDSIINDMFPDIFETNNIITKGSYPKMDIIEYDNNIVAEFEIPGLSKDDVDIKIRDNILTLSGKKNDKSVEREKGIVRCCELKHSSFSRSLILDDIIDEDAIEAVFKNGTLLITLPKKIPERIKPEEKIIKIK